MKRKIFGLPIAIFIIGILVIGGASAAMLDYFGVFSTTLELEAPVQVSDATSTISGTSGGVIEGGEAEVTNIGESEYLLQISTTTEEGIETYYVSELNLVSKVVDFNQNIWLVNPEGPTATIKYVLGGDSFDAEVTEGSIEGYELVYYKDNSDRFNNPAEVIKLADISGDIPYETDGNADEYDYCVTGEYDTCHGAKIWYVPSTAINADNTLDWSRASEFLFESKLIQSSANSQVTIYPGSGFSFNPMFIVDPLYSGTAVMETTVDLVVE